MATEKKEKPQRFVTPVGIASYPRLLGKPDVKFNEAGVWGVKLVFNDMDSPKVQAFKQQLEDLVEVARKEAMEDKEYVAALRKKGKKVTPAELPFFIDGETGALTVGFKMTASGVSKKTGDAWTRKPAVFNADGTPIDPEARLGSGSEMQVSYTLGAFHNGLGYGISLRLEAVRVLKVVEWGQGDASSYGFEVEETEDDEFAGDAATAEGSSDSDDF